MMPSKLLHNMNLRTMSKWTLSLLLIMATQMSFAQGIKFSEGSWDEIKTKAKEEGKPIFVDAYAVWCGPCKWMAKNVFTDEAVGDFFNEEYITYKFDMEKGEGPAFAEEHRVSAYPTLLYFNSDGELVHKTIGAYDANKLLEAAKNALDPEQQIFTLKKKYEGGEKSPEFLLRYAKGLTDANEDATAVATEYLNTKDDWTDETTFKLIVAVFADYKTPIFEKIMKEQDKYVKALGQEAMNEYINYSFATGMQEAIYSNSASDKSKLEADMKKYIPKQANKMIAKFNYYYHGMKGSSKTFKYAKKYFSKYCDDWEELNEVAWALYEDENTSKSQLKTGLSWAQKSVALSRNFFNLDTYACLLYKAEDYKLAKEIAEDAIKLGKGASMDTAETENILKAIKLKMKK